MGLREREVVDHFRRWLERDGWHVELEVAWVDVVATRDDRCIIAEAKGTTSSPGLDVDTAYGQLLRRMRVDEATTYAIVVPIASLRAARRVPPHVLAALRIAVFSVSDDGTVTHEAGPAPDADVDAAEAHRSPRQSDSPAPPAVDAIVSSLSDFSQAWSRSRVLAERHNLPHRGIYAWWFDDLSNDVPVAGTVRDGTWHLLYVGISPARPTSGSSLPTRLSQHLKLNAQGSTLRLSLGSILANRLGLQLRRVGSGKRLTFHCGEERLNAWLADHARVVAIEVDEPWTVEPPVIGELTLPINLDHNADGFSDTLSRLRAEQRAAARELAPDPSCCSS